ncbi:MAG: hypothetical protein Rubg2KO_27280 [Rubricoccaceae bacterium]
MSISSPALESPLAENRLGSTSQMGLPPAVLVALIGLSFLGFLTANPMLTVGALASLPLLAALAWRPGEPPILLFIIGFQWIQATAKVFHANLLGVDVTELVLFADLETPQTARAVWLSLAGLLVLATGMRLVLQRLPPNDLEAIKRRAETFSIPKAFGLYLALTIGLTAMYQSVGYLSSVRQILLAVSLLKWSGFYLLAYLVFFRREKYLFFLAAFGIEFVGGIGFFSGFKEVVFVSVIAFFSVGRSLTVGSALKALAVVIMMLVIGAAWTSVKVEYRDTISGGSGQQEAIIDQGEQINLLVNLVSGLNRQDLVEGLDPLLARVAYVDFFGYVLNAVPTVVPHEKGALWGTAVRHVLLPRVIYPNKPALASDSEVTSRYTGIFLASDGEGTSISIGYMGESYIDFGSIGMFIPIFLLGLGWGLIYLFFVRKAVDPILGYAYSVAILLSAYQLEVASIKLLGGVLMKFIVVAMVFRFTQTWILDWLRSDTVSEDDIADVYEPDVAMSGASREWGWRA